MKNRSVYITGIGSFLPGDPIPFRDIENALGYITDASPKMIKRINRMRSLLSEMLGIEYCHYAIDLKTKKINETNVSMCEKAAKSALRQAGIDPKEIELIIYAGILYDYMCPPSSVLVQETLNIPHCAEISIHSNCTAIYKAIQIASDLIENGRYKNALLVTSQLSSSFLKADYFNQKKITLEQIILRWFLSDGAGALVLESRCNKNNNLNLKIIDTYLESVGLGIEPSMKMVAGAVNSNILKLYERGEHHLFQNISVVSKLAPKLFKKGFASMVLKTGLNVKDIKCFFANIPTRHMMDILQYELPRDFNCPEIKFYTKIATSGYPGAPAIIISLDNYLLENKLSPGDRLVSFVTESSKWMHAGFILDYC